MAEGIVGMIERPNSVLVNLDAQHAGSIDAGRDRAKADLWTEAKRIWLAKSCPSSQ
ncbi:hypothetical protein [Dankookia sp. P2]|uniref:hypothetical protein n=1 Tax=Dankookia sp. P2 TaxID=3423955 RepID=UPI003D66FF9E